MQDIFGCGCLLPSELSYSDLVVKRRQRWNLARRSAQGERFLRMAGALDVAQAMAFWKDPHTEVHRRCLAARALGLLGKHGPTWLAEGVADDNSPLGRARRHATRDAQRRRDAEGRMRELAEAAGKMRQLGTGSAAEVAAVLRDTSAAPERRIAAATILGGLRLRDAVGDLMETLAEGAVTLSWTCMRALTDIGSRHGARRLMEIVRGRYPLPARQEALYALWPLDELRAESLFLHICAAVDTEAEYTRDMATEALRNTSWRHRSQRALAERLSDLSPSVRYAALCACPPVLPEYLRRAIAARLDDPDRVDDHRVIAKLAAEILDRH